MLHHLNDGNLRGNPVEHLLPVSGIMKTSHDAGTAAGGSPRLASEDLLVAVEDSAASHLTLLQIRLPGASLVENPALLAMSVKLIPENRSLGIRTSDNHPPEIILEIILEIIRHLRTIESRGSPASDVTNRPAESRLLPLSIGRESLDMPLQNPSPNNALEATILLLNMKGAMAVVASDALDDPAQPRHRHHRREPRALGELQPQHQHTTVMGMTATVDIDEDIAPLLGRPPVRPQSLVAAPLQPQQPDLQAAATRCPP